MDEIFYELFRDLPRQGPGSKESTLRALEMIPSLPENCQALDIGCGSGAATIDLAGLLKGTITATDNFEYTLNRLQNTIHEKGLDGKVIVSQGDMMDLHFTDQSFDLIWSEGTIYIMGFENGLYQWKRLLKPGGYMAVSEFRWFTDSRPQDAVDYFTSEVPLDATIENALSAINRQGFRLIGHFKIPEKDWFDYYTPMQESCNLFREKYKTNAQAIKTIQWIEEEIYLYQKYKALYGYVFFVMQKL